MISYSENEVCCKWATHTQAPWSEYKIKSKILPKIRRTYAASLLYSYTPQYAQDELERHQSRCLNIIFLTITPYTERLPLLKVHTLKDVFQKLCVSGVENDLCKRSDYTATSLPDNPGIDTLRDYLISEF